MIFILWHTFSTRWFSNFFFSVFRLLLFASVYFCPTFNFSYSNYSTFVIIVYLCLCNVYAVHSAYIEFDISLYDSNKNLTIAVIVCACWLMPSTILLPILIYFILSFLILYLVAVHFLRTFFWLFSVHTLAHSHSYLFSNEFDYVFCISLHRIAQ